MLYIHIPFCKSRCLYCDFFSTTQGTDSKRLFVNALCEELKLRCNYLPNKELSSVYLGGGTPSQLTFNEVKQIMDCVRHFYTIQKDAELTFEANPDDVTPHFVDGLRILGFNRVSLGVQTFNESLLRLLHRRHTAQQARQAVRLLTNVGIHNVSIDLMYGLPKQTFAMFENDLNEAFSLPITHLSSYALTVEEKTPLFQMIKNKELNLPTDDEFLEEYEILMNKAKENNYEHYEISNFALAGCHSKHNSSYWNGTPYLGCGPGAHSYNGYSRRYNLPNLSAYIKANGNCPYETEVLSTDEKFNEMVFTALRTSKGLQLSNIEKYYGEKYLRELLETAKPHLRAQRLTLKSNCLILTRKGLFVSNDIMSDFMRV